MMNKKYNCHNILIVGGGTAGWMTAAQLIVNFPDINIKVIEPSTLQRIGVGEATFNTIKIFFDSLGLKEKDWMPKCNATYKIAIKFSGWGDTKSFFYHPFEKYSSIHGISLNQWWLKLKKQESSIEYSCLSSPTICDKKLSPKFSDHDTFDKITPYPYAYHFDANLLADFLRDFSIQKGVKRIDKEVTSVKINSDGSIRNVTTADMNDHRADLFIDCTGFKGLLINEALKTPFISFSNNLFCDRAVVTTIPREDMEQDINPYTTATTLKSGWAWNIPLYNRTGVGYVYSSLFSTDEKATDDFTRHLGEKNTSDTRILKMRIGRTKKPWVKNCVAIGLSAGFVEPLESTGIFFIQNGISELINHFPVGVPMRSLRKNYNNNMNGCIDGIRDFLVLHYIFSGRNDSDFWKAVKNELEIPSFLKEKIDLWKYRLPSYNNINVNYHGFSSYSYTIMLAGLGFLPDTHMPVLNNLSDSSAIEMFDLIKKRTDILAENLPSHTRYLNELYKG